MPYSPAMTFFEIITLLLLLAIAGGLAFFFFGKKEGGNEAEEKRRLVEEAALLKSEVQQKTQRVGELMSLLEQEKSARSELEGKGKQILAEVLGYKAENKGLREERDELKEKITQFESRENQREKEFERQSTQLENARKKLEEEQERVKREDEERLQQEREEYDRIWNDHENTVIAKLKEVCQLQHIGFSFYENTKLPADFDGSLKPDFLVEFLGQYLIFDAKKSKNLSTYLNEQVKKTAQKMKSSAGFSDIYATVFFVVPVVEYEELKRTFYYEDGISFYVISPGAIEPILAAYKRITEFKNIEKFDPRDREKIVSLLAHYDRHISFQNAVNILLAQEGVRVMQGKEDIQEDIQEEVAIKKRNMRAQKLSDSDLKRLAQSFEEQKKEMNALVSPKAGIKERDLAEVQEALL